MATLSELVGSGELVAIEVELEYRLPWRRLYGTPDFINWLADVLPGLESGIKGAALSPLEQVDALFYEFISGQPMVEDRRFKPLHYKPELHVWEMKTIDIRIFGWFAAMDRFICSFGVMKDELTGLMPPPARRRHDASTYIARTSYVREKLNLDEPKCLTSREYANVLSNAD